MKEKWLFCFILLMVSGCAVHSISSDTKQCLDFSKFRTFNIARPIPSDVNLLHSVAEKNSTSDFIPSMLAALEQGLVEKGFSLEKSNKPDFVVTFSLTPNSQSLLSEEERRFQSGTRGSNFPDANPRGRTFMERQLKIKVQEPSGKILWSGLADHLLPQDYQSPEAQLRIVNEILASMRSC